MRTNYFEDGVIRGPKYTLKFDAGHIACYNEDGKRVFNISKTDDQGGRYRWEKLPGAGEFEAAYPATSEYVDADGAFTCALGLAKAVGIDVSKKENIRKYREALRNLAWCWIHVMGSKAKMPRSTETFLRTMETLINNRIQKADIPAELQGLSLKGRTLVIDLYTEGKAYGDSSTRNLSSTYNFLFRGTKHEPRATWKLVENDGDEISFDALNVVSLNPKVAPDYLKSWNLILAYADNIQINEINYLD